MTDANRWDPARSMCMEPDVFARHEQNRSGPSMNKQTVATAAVILIAGTQVLAQDYAIRRSTVDAGGVVGSVAGSYTLSGTAGQPEAGLLTAGTLTLDGGFWGASAADSCVADFNGDGNVNFFDVSSYITAFNGQSPAADLAAPFGILNFFDIAAFIQTFSDGCP